ncbi:MAG: hypothetical protein DRR42_25085, partial [Gammaproteobacteria bacterium]
GAAFYGIGSTAIKAGGAIFKGAKSAFYLRQFQSIFKAVTPMGAKIPGFNNLYYSFALNTRVGKYFISSGVGAGGSTTGAMKHIVGELTKKYPAIAPEMMEAAIIKELDLAITKAVTGGAFQYDKKILVSTAAAEWELIFGAPQVVGQLPKLYHAVVRGINSL